MINRSILGMAIAAAMGIGGITEARAASYDHMDRLALRIQKQAAELFHEVKAHYRHTPEYRHLISDAVQMYRTAHRTHQIAHEHGCLRQLASSVRSLDRQFHHFEELVHDVENAARHGHGHVHCDTRHVKRILKKMERNIHHLRDDIEEMKPKRRVYHHQASKAPGYNPIRDYRDRDHNRYNDVYGHNHRHRAPEYGYRRAPSRAPTGIRIGRSGIYYNGNGFHFRIGG